ncbi:GNAT family N-acetyltransferase [Permianibacter sp. IMCC34836]|uniref:GNAT family N-acetyltransferase n=1 Tax=Permianibacter fluminis TaxID=2738515 RepID=UPI0015534C8D|nr:GNAT family N-acetyltransferase [Permianibacter fluminis]NQD38650.1 GNAT family N-acetyltransferase [Permianibacter fluminis]
MTDLVIRAATPAEVPQILAFIKALAVYEKLEHMVVADEQKLAATLFGERPAAEVRLAEWQGKPAGFALFFANYSTFLAKPGIYLEDLFVLPEYRGKGIGKAMLIHLAKLAVERDCGRLEWSVLDWNTPAIEFYQSLGAVPMDEWTVYRVTGAALPALAKM